MVSRKSHLKSRNGCQNCKKRRIKCDERSPSCGNCTKHSIVCNFARKGPTADLQRRHQSNHDDENLTLNTENFSLQERTISSKQIAPSLPVEELELFYHFITATCFTLSDRPKSHELWQKVVPKHAFAHTPLLRGILATSALHLSQSSPERRDHYLLIAGYHQDLALSSFRSIMKEINEANCHAFFALSSLIIVYAFASSQTVQSPTSENDHMLSEWPPLVRGCNSILQTVWPWLMKGDLRGLFEDKLEARSCSKLPDAVDAQLNHLSEVCQQTAGGLDRVETCKHAVEELRSCFAKFYYLRPDRCEVSVAFIWPVMVQPTFLAMLAAREPEALAILAFYSVVLYQLDGYWWMTGRGLLLLETIRRELREPWQNLLEWPIEMIKSHERLRAI